MGGHDAGDFASQSLVAELETLERPDNARELLAGIEERVIAANTVLRRAAAEKGPQTVIGCTLAALVIYDDAYACIWSGDSRVYRLRHGQLEQISRDHTEAQELIDRGTLTPEEAREWPRRNVITRAIGVFDQPELEMVQGRIEDGDTFVICSDGLNEHVEDHEIEDRASHHPPRRVVDELIGLTLERGAKDNVTVVAVTCREVTALQPGIAVANRGHT
jgi:protein phosphatase